MLSFSFFCGVKLDFYLVKPLIPHLFQQKKGLKGVKIATPQYPNDKSGCFYQKNATFALFFRKFCNYKWEIS
ncbi:MAG: hypothetical protein RL757_806 [Bacteroidota bacterium]|jgi:hypothetical protein